ncbi:MAG: BTAD domain-containing putative transcriptional regulator [Spirochaetia bacterium]|jgi:ATP/maltotriose-dependent transcriptional regulator MalT/DNA-binding SARP family transcriptional activator|nr:BTAD domain-containing putative transcriptional regulator [Spirochaetia bacterium]
MLNRNNENKFELNDFTNPKLYNILNRERFINLLKNRYRRKLILIHAKAGQGKSTIAADFIRRMNLNSKWIRLTENDSKSIILLNKLHAGIETLYPENRTSTLSNDFDPSINSLFDKINKITVKPFYLVLEDFQNINRSSESCKIINQIIESSHADVHIIILSREYPKLSFSKLRSQKEMFELSDKDIEFLEEDVQGLISEIYKLKFTPVELQKICGIIDGWTTGYIFLFEKLSCTDSKDKQHLLLQEFLETPFLSEALEFFEEQIYSKCSHEEQVSLVKLSFFKNITPEFAGRILKEDDQEILNNFKANGHFLIVSDKKKDYYSFYSIFRYVLQLHSNDLNQSIISEILRIGANFYKETGDFENSIVNLIRLKQIDEAVNLFLDYAEELLDQSKYRKIRRILDIFPSDIIENNQLLLFNRIIANNLNNPFSTRKKLPELMDYFVEQKDYDRQARIYSVLLANYFFYQDNKQIVSATAGEAENFLAKYGKYLSEHRKEILEALIPIGQDWKTTLDDTAFERVIQAEETSRRLNNHEAFLCSRLVMARKHIQRGEFKTANKLLEKTQDILENSSQDHPYKALVSFYIGDTYFYLGDIYKAIGNTQKALTQAGSDFAFRPYLEQNLILYHLYLDKYEPAEQMLEDSRQNEQYENLYIQYFRSYLLPMLAAYRNGNTRRTDYYSKQLMDNKNEDLLLSDYPYSYLQLIEVNISLGFLKSAEELLVKMESDISNKYTPYAAATMYALKGILLSLQGKEKDAVRQFTLMDAIFSEKGYHNLDICNPEILSKVSELSKYKYFTDFPRLKSRLIASSFKEKAYLLEITTLGSFNLFINGKEIASSKLMGQKRVMDLLKMLIIYRKNGVLKDKIYDPFWPKYSSKSARDNLNTITYRLRNILGKKNDILLTDSNTIGFKKGTTITDVDQFLELIRLGETAGRQNEQGIAIGMYSRALGIYNGDFLEGDIYSDFIRDERENLKQKYLTVLFKVSILYLNTGNYLQALETLKILINKDPLCEAGTRLLMITSALMDSRSNIPRILDNLNRQLTEAFDVSVDKKTIHLQEMLLAGEDPRPEMWINETII